MNQLASMEYTAVRPHMLKNLDVLLKEAVNLFKNDVDSGVNFSGELASSTAFKQELPQLIENSLNLKKTEYLVKGSIGQGGFAQVPWVCIFDRTITVKASEGIYIVFLVSADLKTIYLSLNNGVTYFKERFGYKKGREELSKVSAFMRNKYCMVQPHLSLVDIDLKSDTQLAKSYECGHILGTAYSIEALPSHDKLVSDLIDIMAQYKRIVEAKRNRSLTEFYNFMSSEVGEDVYSDEELNDAVDKELSVRKSAAKKKGPKPKTPKLPTYEGPKPKQPLVQDDSGTWKYPRSAKVSANALQIAQYMCEYDNTHFTFLRESTDLPYTEGHHLIPLSAHDEFDNSLDVEENVVSKCVVCHRILHHGKKEDKLPILKKLYEQRKDLLRKAGIEISFIDLLKYYGIEQE